MVRRPFRFAVRRPFLALAGAVSLPVAFAAVVAYYVAFVWPSVFASSFGLGAHAFGLLVLSYVFEPVLVVAASWAVAHRSPAAASRGLLPALLVACFLGYYAGFGVAALAFPVPGVQTPAGAVPSLAWFAVPALSTLELWAAALEPPVRAFLGALAGVGVAALSRSTAPPSPARTR